MSEKTLIEQFTYLARNIRCRVLFEVLKKYCRGDVLDVGGRDFFLSAKKAGVPYKSWTTLDQSGRFLEGVRDDHFKIVVGDGCHMNFMDESFDTIVNIQVLEHVLEPILMVKEIARVLKKNGTAIFLIPQTSVLHELPQHYYNFTRFWIKKVMENAGFEIVKLIPLGGVWSSMASHLVYFFFQAHRAKGISTLEFQRNGLFYVLYPFMLIFAIVSFPVCMLLSLGDLTEEPNNHLVVVKKF